MADHLSQDRFFRLVAGIHLHADGNLVAVKEKAQPDNGGFLVFFTGSFFTEIILPVNFKIEVGTVEIGMRGIKTEYRFDLGGENLNEFLVIIA